MDKFRDIEDLASFVEAVFGDKARVLTVSPTTGRITFVLYDAFAFNATLDQLTHTFGLSLLLPGNSSLITLLGQKLSANNDADSIKRAFAIADEYCRLRLSDRYLAAYAQAEETNVDPERGRRV